MSALDVLRDQRRVEDGTTGKNSCKKDTEAARMGDQGACPQCMGAGWVLDAKLDAHPTTLELIPCVYPPCPFSARPVAVLCLYGEWTAPVLHPQSGHVMSLSPVGPQDGLKMTKVISSNIDQVGYDLAAAELHVAFKDGRHYVFDDITPSFYTELLLADSKGSYLNRNAGPGRRVDG